MLHFTKNKISGFKEKLVLDLNVSNIFLSPVDPERAREDTALYINRKESKRVAIQDNIYTEIEASEYNSEEKYT